MDYRNSSSHAIGRKAFLHDRHGRFSDLALRRRELAELERWVRNLRIRSKDELHWRFWQIHEACQDLPLEEALIADGHLCRICDEVAEAWGVQ